MKLLIFFIFLSFLSFNLSAQLGEIVVIGNKEEEGSLTGSAHYIDQEKLTQVVTGDINRVLREVPGVYLREEDGMGLFPSISLRGTDPNRSSKILLMEDGVPIAPAPYSAPEAYFFPNSARMSGLEVLKGSAQIKYGPQTAGGVINFHSTHFGEQRKTKVRSYSGTQREVMNHLTHTDRKNNWAYVVELFNRTNEGFKQLEPTESNSNNAHTGFRQFEPQARIKYTSDNKLQSFEFKYGMTRMNANETYLGLSDEDFNQNPFMRYSASRFDYFDATQHRSYLRHQVQLSSDSSLTSTAYFNKFERVWYKLDKVNGSIGLADPASRDILRGRAAGTLNIRNNDRAYQSMGVEEVYKKKITKDKVSHQFELGLRIHHDYIQSNNRTDDFTQDASGRITGVTRGATGDGRNSAYATSLYLEDSINMGALTIVPGLRGEFVKFRTQDKLANTGSDKKLELMSAGVGANYKLRNKDSLFMGIYQGNTLPNAADYVKNDIRPERSVTLELGHRHRNLNGVESELTLFHTELRDIYVPQNLILGSPVSENAGKVRSTGLESSLRYDLAQSMQVSFAWPVILTYTYTNAKLASDSNSQSSGSFFYKGRKGNRLPYIPEHQLTLASGIAKDKWEVMFRAHYVGQVYSTASNTDESHTDARIGSIPNYFLLDMNVDYMLSNQSRVFVALQNIANKSYMVSRHAYGPRPGRPFSAFAGIEMSFD